MIQWYKGLGRVQRTGVKILMSNAIAVLALLVTAIVKW